MPGWTQANIAKRCCGREYQGPVPQSKTDAERLAGEQQRMRRRTRKRIDGKATYQPR